MKQLYVLFFLLLQLCFFSRCGDSDEMPTIDPPVEENPTLLAVPSIYGTIQEALNEADSGDTIVVAPGSYDEEIRISKSNILVTSQFYVDQDPSTIRSTIIMGQGASVVTFVSGVPTSTVFQGFTVTGGKGNLYNRPNGSMSRGGGGIQGVNASPVVRFNIIEDNEAILVGDNAFAGGGGIRFEEGAPQIINNIIRNNRGNFAGGIFMESTNALIQNNIIESNAALLDEFGGGGGLYLDFAGSTGNQVVNNTIVNNNSAGNGGGFIVAGTTGLDNLEFQNNIVYNNENDEIVVRFGISISDFSAMYCLIEGGLDNGESILDSDPVLDADFFNLTENSPCIDAGNPENSYNDYQGANSPALGTERNDLGAFGGPNARNL